MTIQQQSRNRLGEPVPRFGPVSNTASLLTPFGMRQSGWVGSSDLLPLNRTAHISKKSITLENDGHENKQI